jgi:ComF family protein
MHRALKSLRRRLDSLVWALLPGICILCAARTDAAADLCDACRVSLPIIEQPCRRCASFVTDTDERLCAPCRLRPPPFVRTVAALRYVEPVTRMIHRLKFHGSRVDARVLGALLAACIRDEYRNDASAPGLVIPVPLSAKRLLRRGHNQAALLARWAGGALDHDVSIDYRSCRRIRDTPPQSGLNRAARLRNLEGAFSVTRSLTDARVAIVDDVMTTGSTVTALAHTLLDAGAAEVHVWAVARTPRVDSENTVPIGHGIDPLESAAGTRRVRR